MPECITPFFVKQKTGIDKIPVPCGKCPVCFKRKVSHWSFRLQQQDKYSHESHFITLTYDTKHLPISENGYQSLCKRDVQLFFKRLRKANSCTLKYFAVGEYGGKTARPHYHVLLFNAAIQTIQPAWGLGHCHYGFVSGASVGYTLKYMMKGRWRPYSDDDDREPQRAFMSKGLGLDYLTPQAIRWHLDDPTERMYLPLKDGKKVSMPRYYKERIYWPSLQKAVGIIQRDRMFKEKEEAIAKGGEMYFNNEREAQMALYRRHEYDLISSQSIF